MKFSLSTLALTGALVLALGSSAHAQIVGTIDGGYVGDNMQFNINNTGSLNFTNVVLSASLYGASSDNIGTVVAGGSVSDSSGIYGGDPDDLSYSEFPVTLTGLYGSTPFSVTFSPSVNASGSFVDFEGTGPDNDFNPVHVADITAATPEPGSIALLVGMSVSGAGFLVRRRNARKVA